MNLPILTAGTDPEEFQLLVEQARKASDLLKSLSHEVRLLILCLLSEGEKSVSELEDILTMPQAAVSQQLARLRSDGLVASRREGRMIFYSLTDSEVRDIIAALYDLFCKDARPDQG
ncbi:metalloregulator ArsR/SmtB family transcription factor [Labrenzia sp. CE80]|uniref:ArsR/SmtB family transcription factor n=1 Tax=Labrenzia sp. CE80 TaxID=1788986 RepID=UPI00129B3BB1|nr:metalloregulator ArsR/SmtB family transcription factor [Labrenzia sp. CE80]